MEKKPVLYGVVGCPGAGKTCLTDKLLETGLLPSDILRHDPDLVMADLEEYQQDMKKHGFQTAFENWELTARNLANKQVKQAFLKRQSFIYERTLGTPEAFDFVHKVFCAGYALDFHLVTIRLETALSRVQERQKKKERFLEETAVVERIRILSQLTENLINLCDRIVVYDNNDLTNPHRRIAFKENGKFVIEDKATFENFLKYGK